MSKCTDRSTASGHDAAFHTTHWTEIFDASSEDALKEQVALQGLLRRYWKPVYYYLRCKGSDREAAKDLTQGFFHEIVLGRGLIQQADRTKGRFRTFLLRALDRYATSVHRAEKAKHRMPEGGLASLKDIDWINIPEPVHCATPRETFDYTWASVLLDQVLADVEGKYRSRGNITHWEIFQDRVLQPIMDGVDPPSLADLCRKHGILNQAKASNMIFTVKRRFRAVLRRTIRPLVESEAEIDDEVRHLMRVFSKRNARF